MIHPWQAERERAAAAFAFAFRKRFTAVAARNGANNKQPESGSFHLARGVAMHAIKTLEDALELPARYAQCHCRVRAE